MNVSEEDEKKLGWGLCLRASPRKGMAKEAEELAAITSSRRQLFVTKGECLSGSIGHKVDVNMRINGKKKAVKVGGVADIREEENVLTGEMVTGVNSVRGELIDGEMNTGAGSKWWVRRRL